MKRNLVMDLFEGKRTEEIGEWHDFSKSSPKLKKDKVKIKCQNGDECFAYYYEDRGLSSLHENSRSHFWHTETHEPIHNVTHWKYLK